MARPRSLNREAIKSERVSIALTPAIFNAANTLAQIQGISLSGFVASLIEGAVKKKEHVIEKFNAALADARAGLEEVSDED